MTILVGLLLAGLLFVVGRWGRREAAALAPSYLPPQDRVRRERTLLRGAMACEVVAVAATAATIASLLLRR